MGAPLARAALNYALKAIQGPGKVSRLIGEAERVRPMAEMYLWTHKDVGDMWGKEFREGFEATQPKPKLKKRPGPKKKTSKDTKKVIHAKRKKAKSPHKYNPSGQRTVVGPNPDSKEASANRKAAAKLKKIKVNPRRKK